MDTQLKKIKIYDSNFAHAKFSTDYQESKYIVWDRNVGNNSLPIFYTDNFINTEIKSGGKSYAWLLEPESVSPNIYQEIKKINLNFKNVLTYDKDLLDIGENYIFYPFGGCWIHPDDHKIYPKSKLISIIASTKNQTDGHQLRHKIIEKYDNKIHTYGRGYNPVEHKIECLKDYRFSIVIENIKKDYYFTEKLIDCFMTGTIPIYYGCPSIVDFFDLDGIITFNNIQELETILDGLTPSLYDKKINSITKNFEIAKKYLISEDWIKENLNII